MGRRRLVKRCGGQRPDWAVASAPRRHRRTLTVDATRCSMGGTYWPGGRDAATTPSRPHRTGGSAEDLGCRAMGVAADLGYVHSRPNVVQRGMQAFASSRPGAWMFSKVLAPLDRIVHRVSKGKTTLPQVLAGLPVVFVTTTGRKSGQPRTSPLIAVPIHDTLALVGTNFGQTATPAWVLNLEADPAARASHRDHEIDVTARPATEDERETVWRAAAGVYPGYEKYQARITDRAIRVFVLEP